MVNALGCVNLLIILEGVFYPTSSVFYESSQVVSEEEDVTREEIQEERDFIDACVDTKVMENIYTY